MNKNKRLQKAIDDKGLRKNCLAKRVGVTPQALSSWLSGKHKPTNLLTKKALAEVLGVDVFADDNGYE